MRNLKELGGIQMLKSSRTLTLSLRESQPTVNQVSGPTESKVTGIGTRILQVIY